MTQANPTLKREIVASALWWLTIANLLIAVVLWTRPGPPKEAAAPDSGTAPTPNPNAVPTAVKGPGGMPPPPIDMKNFTAAPPVAGRPTAAAIDAAIRRGTDAFLHLYVEPSLATVETGGFLDYVDAQGKTTRLGPNVYVQCHLYLIVHLLMYYADFGIARDHPLVQRAARFLISTFDDEQGRWIWSEEGCLHAKGLVALANLGEMERFQKGWQWTLASPLHVAWPAAPEALRDGDPGGLFTMMQSGSIVQTLGAATRSLTGEHTWEHNAPIPDEENTIKYLFALLAAGRGPEDPAVAGFARRLSAFLAENPLAIGHMNTRHIVGRTWTVYAFAHWRFPPDDGYRVALAQMRAAGRGEWRINLMMRILPGFRGDLVRGLLETGIDDDEDQEIGAIINGFVAAQDVDGAWRVPHIGAMWGFDHPPAKGYKYGNMDGANTYLVTLALIAWRQHVLKD